MAELTGSEILARCLKKEGTDNLFFIMGGPMLLAELPPSRKASARSTRATSRVRPSWRRPIRG